MEEGQTEYIFECRAKIVANGHFKRAYQCAIWKWNQVGWRLAKILLRKRGLVLFGSNMLLQQETEKATWKLQLIYVEPDYGG